MNLLLRNWTNDFCGFTAQKKSPVCVCEQKVCPEMLFVLDTRLFPALALIRELERRAESCAGFAQGKHNWRLQCQCLCQIPELRAQTPVSSSIPKFSCRTFVRGCFQIPVSHWAGGAFPWFISLHLELFGKFRCCSRVIFSCFNRGWWETGAKVCPEQLWYHLEHP